MPGNPFAHLGKIQHPSFNTYVGNVQFECLTDRYVLENICSRIWTYFGLILCLWKHTTCLWRFAWTCKLTWNFYNAYPVETGAVVMKTRISLNVKAKHRRHIAWFHKHNIKRKYMKIRLERLPSTYLCISKINQNGHFRVNITRWTLYFSQGGRMGYPAWHGPLQTKHWGHSWFYCAKYPHFPASA